MKIWANLLLWFMVGLSPLESIAQIRPLLQEIAQAQVKQDSFYHRGHFPGQLMRGKKIRADNSAFFTALTLYTLQSLHDSLSVEEQDLVSNIVSKALPAFQFYKNRNGGITYNFYQTKPDSPFPGIPWLANSNRGLLPDDLDDTSMIALVHNFADSLNAAIKSAMRQQVQLKARVRSAPRAYRKALVYPTWFAKRMRQDIDLCVMVNVLTFVLEKNLPIDSIDYETMALIKHVVEKGMHMKRPFLVSSHYQNSAIILYHVARLIALSPQPRWAETRSQIIRDLHDSYTQQLTAMEKVIILTSLYRLNMPMQFELTQDEIKQSMNAFSWFGATPLYGSPVWIKRMLGPKGLYQLQYRSTAYYQALVLELMVLSGASWSQNEGEVVLSNKITSNK